MLIENDQEDMDNQTTRFLKYGYDEEEAYLLDIRKKDLSSKLSKISKSLDNKNLIL